MTVTRMEGAHADRTSDLEVRRGRTRRAQPRWARPRWTRSLAAAGLSLLWPGLGHAFLGRTAAAVALVSAQVLLVVLTVLPGFWRVTVPVWALLVLTATVTAAWAARHDAAAPVD